MKSFFDASALAKRYIEEHGSAAADEVCMATDRLGLSVICELEIVSALNRRLREKNLSREQYLLAKQRLCADIRDADMVAVTNEVVGMATVVLESVPVRAMDAIHIASARVWGADLFVSADKAQAKSAEWFGLKTRLV